MERSVVGEGDSAKRSGGGASFAAGSLRHEVEDANPAAALLVCVTCKSDAGPMGAGLFEALSVRLAGEGDIALRPIECLSVCKRPCTVALAAPGKWTYVVGDLTAEAHVEDIVTAARRYAASPEGIVPWRERPLSFRKGVVSRTPPLALPATSLA